MDHPNLYELQVESMKNLDESSFDIAAYAIEKSLEASVHNRHLTSYEIVKLDPEEIDLILSQPARTRRFRLINIGPFRESSREEVGFSFILNRIYNYMYQLYWGFDRSKYILEGDQILIKPHGSKLYKAQLFQIKKLLYDTPEMKDKLAIINKKLKKEFNRVKETETKNPIEYSDEFESYFIGKNTITKENGVWVPKTSDRFKSHLEKNFDQSKWEDKSKYLVFLLNLKENPEKYDDEIEEYVRYIQFEIDPYVIKDLRSTVTGYL